MNLTNYTLSQLRAATKTQIITAIGNYLAANFTKRQLIIFLLDRDTEPNAPVIICRKDRLLESQIETVRDVKTGAAVSGKQIIWTYYDVKGAPVDTITIVETDAAGKEVARKKIKHFTDGRQPEVLK